MSLTKIPDSSLLATDYDVQNSFTAAMKGAGSEQSRNFVTYIKNLFQEYIKARSEGQTSDQYKINKELLKKFRDDFYKFITEIADDAGNKLDLDTIIDEIYKQNDIQNKIKIEITTVVVSTLKQVLKEKISGKIQNKMSVLDINKAVQKIELHQVSDKETTRIINSVIGASHPEISRIEQEFQSAHNDFKTQLFEMFTKEIAEPNKKRHYLEKLESRKKSNYVLERFDLFGKIDKTTQKRVDSLVEKLLFLMNNSWIERVIIHSKKILKFFITAPMKIVKAVSRFVRGLVGGIFRGVVSVVSNLLLKPLHFILSKSFQIIGSLTKGIYKTLKTVVLKTGGQFLLFTPPGMYALGFLLGFIWGKLKQMIPGLTFSVDGVIKLFKALYGAAMKLYKELEEKLDEFLADHPNLDKLWEGAKNLNEKAKWEGSYWEAFKTTEIYKKLQVLKKSSWWSIIRGAINTVTSFLSWITDHPYLSSFLYGGTKMYNTVRIIKNMASMVRIPFKGGLLGGLVALGAGYATQAATEAVIGIFSGESSLSSASWKMGEKQEQLYSLMMNSSNSKVFDKSEEMRYKYGIVNDYILGQYQKISEMKRDLDFILKMKEGDKSFDKTINNNLKMSFPNFVNRILENGGGEKTRQAFFDALQKGNVNKQISSLMDILREQTDELSNMQYQLNNATEQTVNDVLNSMIDDNMNVKLKTTDAFGSAVKRMLNSNINAYIMHDKMLESGTYSEEVEKLKKYRKKFTPSGVVKKFAGETQGMSEDEKKRYREIFTQKMIEINKTNGYFTMSPTDLKAYEESGIVDIEKLQRGNLSNNREPLEKLLKEKYSDETQRTAIIDKMLKYATSEQWKSIQEMVEKTKGVDKPNQDVIKQMEQVAENIHNTTKSRIEKPMIDATTFFNNMRQNKEKENERILLECKRQNEENKEKHFTVNYPYHKYDEKIRLLESN